MEDEKPFDPAQAVVDAVLKTLRKDFLLFQSGVSERAITHRIAVYLEQALFTVGMPGWDVDCEYNRNGCVPKRIEAQRAAMKERPQEVGEERGSRVFPDIVVHHRAKGGHAHNLLVLEVKLGGTDEEKRWDVEKLDSYKTELEYQHAYFIDLAGLTQGSTEDDVLARLEAP